MPITTTAALVGGLVLSAAATGAQTVMSRQQAKKQDKRIAAQERQARIEARERSLLDGAREDTGADVQLGREEAAAAATGSAAGTGGATSRSGSVGARVGGVRKKRPAAGMTGPSVSSRIGL